MDIRRKFRIVILIMVMLFLLAISVLFIFGKGLKFRPNWENEKWFGWSPYDK